MNGDSMLLKKYFACLLSLLVLMGLLVPGSVNAQSDSVEKTRSKVHTLSTNRDKQIEVKLHDKTKIKGYIVSVDSDSFTVADSSTATSQKVLYSDVDEVKKVSSGFSAKTWLILGGVAAGTVATWLIVKPAVCDGGAQSRGIC
jgi:small nuclear ribonucleoprotein (snRNP)-like protein